jgi:serine protease AprX
MSFRAGRRMTAFLGATILTASAWAAGPGSFLPASAARVVLGEGKVEVAWWTESGRAYYRIDSADAAAPVTREADFTLELRAGRFDPMTSAVSTPPALAARPGTQLQIVQFWSQPLPEYREALEAAGAKVRHYLANQAFIVAVPAEAQNVVSAMPFVRWMGAYEPAYRLEEEIFDGLVDGTLPAEARYNLQIAGRGMADKQPVVDEIAALGGRIDACIPQGFVVEATLTPAQLLSLAHSDNVIFIDRWLPPTTYMNNVRIVGGANYVETVAGFTGAGVRGEVMDSNLAANHVDFQAIPPIFHGNRGGSATHGTSVYGIVFGTGTGNANGRGMLPSAQGIFADFGNLTNRYNHIGELKQAPYFAVFQTNSWGSCCTTQYGTAAATMDDILFDHDIVLLQAQANEGSQNSDQSAWAKNCVSVGGIRHNNNANLADDVWNFAGSIGPAADGRIKPDLSFWFDSIYTTNDTGGYTSSFGGTSAATPMTAGHFGLFFEMWSHGIFGNPVDPAGTVFDNRPHMTTAKAMLINTARPYPFANANADLRRTTQGWGLASAQRLYDLRDSFLIVDETDVLANLQSTDYFVTVAPDSPELRVTLVYADPPGVPASSRHRVNDLTLRVIAPNGTIYYGNNGLRDGNVSTPGGSPNTIDTVENVWIPSPAAGEWQITVSADEIVQDAHIETPEVDADYALVVSGIVRSKPFALGDLNCDGVVSVGDIGAFVLALTDPAAYAAGFPACDITLADFNGDGVISVGDIGGFVAVIVP